MSKAEELLDSLSIEDIQPFTSQPDIEGHIVIDKDRIIHVPTELKRIAVQYDANIETVIFDCPRYWDEHDLSEMNIYINYKLPGNLINNIGQSLAKNLRINEDDENIINFDWTIGPILTNNKGDLPFSVCAKSKTNQDSDEAIRWYTEINTELTISEGMDGSGDIEDNYEDLFPDIINDIITKLDGIKATYDEKLDAFNANATSKTESFDTNAETRTTEFNNNAAQKTLDYNNNCTSKTESFNQNSIQKVTEFNDNYTSKLSSFNSNADSRIEEFDTHADLALNSIPKNNAEGTDNTITDALDKQLFALSGDGKSEQVVTTGKNLLPYPYVDTTKTENGITFTDNGDGTITVNGTATAGTFFKVFATQTNQEEIPGNYISGSATGCNVIVAHKQDTTYTRLGASSNGNSSLINKETYAIGYIELSISQGTTLNNVIVKPMLTLEQDTSYEPYTRGQPSPSPDYEQPINSIEGSLEFDCRGKNLLPYPYPNSSKTNAGITFTVNDDGTVTVDGTSTAFISFQIYGSNSIGGGVNIPGNYVSGGSDKVQVGVFRNNGDNNYSELANNKGGFTEINKTSYTDGYVEVRINQGITVNNEIIRPMLSNEQNVDWEPYIEPNQVTFNLNDEKLRSVGDVKDELVVDLDTGDYYKVENIDEVVLDGSESWVLQSINEYGIANFKYKTGKEVYPINFNVISNYFASQNTSISQTKTNGIFMQWQNELHIRIEQEKASTVEEFKQWLSTHTTIVNYQLATSTTKKLGTLSSEDLAKLKTFKGYNNVTVNTNLGLMNIRFTYGLDIKKYVDNKIAEISTAMIEEG